MILKYMLPKSMESQITLTGDERIYYSVPIDIDESGKWSDNSFLVVTTRKVYILRESDSKVYDIKDLQKATAEPGVGGGLLTVKSQGVDRVLAHYSSKHLGRYAYVARGINILISGRYEEVESPEYEKMDRRIHADGSCCYNNTR